MKIALATGNPHKAEEFTRMWGGRVDIDVAPDGFDPDETGTTLVQNALIKATALRPLVGDDTLVVADDSGLAVRALDGRPGVYSARYAGEDATFADNNALLLRELEGSDDRRAAFLCVLVALAADGSMRVSQGTLAGHIAPAVMGERGFGYDPVFVPLDDERSMAQMSADEKNRISHRGRAARGMARLLGFAADAA